MSRFFTTCAIFTHLSPHFFLPSAKSAFSCNDYRPLFNTGDFFLEDDVFLIVDFFLDFFPEEDDAEGNDVEVFSYRIEYKVTQLLFLTIFTMIFLLAAIFTVTPWPILLSKCGKPYCSFPLTVQYPSLVSPRATSFVDGFCVE